MLGHIEPITSAQRMHSLNQRFVVITGKVVDHLPHELCVLRLGFGVDLTKEISIAGLRKHAVDRGIGKSASAEASSVNLPGDVKKDNIFKP